MDVSCPQCETLFELEASQLSSGNATLKCSECQHVFRIRSEVENTKRWMLKNQSGDVSYFSTFDVLHQWMMEQKVSKDDVVSRSGQNWVTLDSIGEFAPVFQVLESIKDLLPKSPDKDPVLEIPPEIRTQKPSRPRVRTEQQFVNFAEIEQTRDLENDADDDFIFGKDEADISPKIQSKPRREATASVRVPKSADSTGSLELPWEMSEEVGIPKPQIQNQKSSWIFKTVFVLLFLAVFGAGIFYLVSMKRETTQISLGTDTDPTPTENIEKANTLIHGAVTQAETKLLAEESEVWNKRFIDTQIPIREAIAKATLRAKKKGAVSNTETMLERGLKALESGNLALARGSFIHVLDAQPGNSEAVTGLGWVKLESGNASAATRDFRRALRLNPNYQQAYMGLGQALRESGQLKDALNAYSKYLERFPRGSRAGIARYQKGELTRKLGLDKDEEKLNVEKKEEVKIVDKKEETEVVDKKDEPDLEPKKDSLSLDKKDDGTTQN